MRGFRSHGRGHMSMRKDSNTLPFVRLDLDGSRHIRPATTSASPDSSHGVGALSVFYQLTPDTVGHRDRLVDAVIEVAVKHSGQPAVEHRIVNPAGDGIHVASGILLIFFPHPSFQFRVTQLWEIEPTTDPARAMFDDLYRHLASSALEVGWLDLSWALLGADEARHLLTESAAGSVEAAHTAAHELIYRPGDYAHWRQRSAATCPYSGLVAMLEGWELLPEMAPRVLASEYAGFSEDDKKVWELAWTLVKGGITPSEAASTAAELLTAEPKPN